MCSEGGDERDLVSLINYYDTGKCLGVTIKHTLLPLASLGFSPYIDIGGRIGKQNIISFDFSYNLNFTTY